MENFAASNTTETVGNSQSSYLDETLQLNINGIPDNENLGFLYEFDSCWEDLTDRLIFSEVKDSVTEGVIHAMSQEANDILVAKDLELAALNQLLSEWQMTQELQGELYQLIIHGAIRDISDEYERKIMKTQSSGGKSTRLCENIVEILNDLDAVQKIVSEHISHGSLEFDHLHHKVSQSSSVWENGESEQCKVNLPEKYESSNLVHLKVEELYTYFRDLITKVKRDHESTIQAMTEDYYGLKREFLKQREVLKEKGLFLPSKSKDYDVLKKAIPAISLKLNNIIIEDAKYSSETHDLLGDKLNNLLAENKRLRDMLDDKMQMPENWNSAASSTEQKLAKHYLDDTNVCRTVQDFTKSVENSVVESFVNDEVFKTIIREMASRNESDNEEYAMTSVILQDFFRTLYEEAMQDGRDAMSSDPEDGSLMMTVMMQGITELVSREALVSMEKEIKRLAVSCWEKDQLIVNLQSKVTDMEGALHAGAQETETCRGLLSKLEVEVKVRDEILRDHTRKHEALIHQKDCELDVLKAELDQAKRQINSYQDQVDKLMKTAELISISHLSADRIYRECLGQMNSVAHHILELTNRLADFEVKTTERIKWNNLRVENSTFQLESLTKKANVHRRTGLLYKQRLEQRCSDLKKAEAEVDILGDQVDTLLSLLDKIYIALDHYSPILRHYPGIMEILKLVRKELHGAESAKSVCATP